MFQFFLFHFGGFGGVDVSDLGFLKSVTYQPFPFKSKPAALKSGREKLKLWHAGILYEPLHWPCEYSS